MLFNIIVFSPFTAIETEAAAAVAGTDYKVITASDLNSKGAATSAGSDFTVKYTTDSGKNVISFKANETSDPNAWLDFSSFSINVSTYKYIVFTGKTTKIKGYNSSQLFYITSNSSINGSYLGSFYTQACNKFMSYVIELSSAVASKGGTYGKCRFDVFSAPDVGDEYLLESVMFVDDYALAQALAWQRSASLNGDTSNAPVFKGPGLANYLDIYKGVSGNTTSYDYTTYDSSEDSVKIYANVTKSDPKVEFNFRGVSSLITDFNTTNYKYMVITYKADLNTARSTLDVKGDDYTVMQTFMMTSTYPSAGDGVQPTYRVFSDGEYHSVIVDLADESKWTGDITALRLDYLGEVYAGESFYIDSIAFYKQGTANSTLRKTASVAALSNNLRKSNGGSVSKGQFNAGYDLQAMFDHYRSGSSAYTFKYDPQEDAMMLLANTNVNDANMRIALNEPNYGFSTGNYDYLTITYMIPDWQDYSSAKIYFLSTDQNSDNESRAVTFDLIADGKYHSYVVDFSSLAWGGNFTSLRFDFVQSRGGSGAGVASQGDYIYIDSLCLYKTEAEARAKAWEVYEKRNYSEGEFIADPEILPIFKDTSAKNESGNYVSSIVGVEYDGTEDAIKIYNQSGVASADDPQVNVRITQLTDALSTDVYEYVVITYKASCTAYANGGNMQFFGYTTPAKDAANKGTGNGADDDLSFTLAGVNDNDEYHAAIFSFYDKGKWNGDTTGFRFDFVGTLYAGDVMYVDSIIYCKTLDEAYQTAFERTNYRNHEKVTNGGIDHKDGVIDSWEQMYLIDADSGNEKRQTPTNKKGADVVYSEYTKNLKINTSTSTTEGGVKATGNQTLTYNIDRLGLVAEDHEYIIITYKVKDNDQSTTSYVTTSTSGDTVIKSQISNIICNFTLSVDGLGGGQIANFTEPVYTDTDIGLVAGTEFHALRIDLSNPTYSSWWTGNINGFTIQFDDLNSANDSGLEVYIESIIFAGNDEKESGILACNKANTINGISEKNTMGDGTTAYLYYATPEMVYLIGSRHMCEASYDQAHMAVKITICNYCTTTLDGRSHVGAGGWFTCTASYFDLVGDGQQYHQYADSIGAYDPISYFYLTEDIPLSTCDYLVVSYMTPETANGLVDLAGQHPNPQGQGDYNSNGNYTNHTYSVYNGYVDIGIYPVLVTSSPDPEYQRNFKITDQNTYYSAYTDLTQSGLADASALTNIRIDPFQITFVRPGYSVYISTIALAKNESNAKALSEAQLNKFYPYNFTLSYSAGDGASDPTLENLPATASESRTRSNSFSFNVAYATPTRANYDFVAWKYGNTIVDEGDPIVLTSTKTLEQALLNPAAAAVSASLTAQWEEKTATITYQVVGPDGYGQISTTSQTIKISSGSPSNVTLTLHEHFRFTGWYYEDENSVEHKVSDNLTLTASQMSNQKKDLGNGGGVVWVPVAYYAKVEYMTSDMTVSLPDVVASHRDQTFIVTITASGGSVANGTIPFAPLSLVLKYGETAVIKGLYGGDYTITVNDKWSWRFSASSKSQTVNNQLAEAPNISFSYGAIVESRWLNDLHMVAR